MQDLKNGISQRKFRIINLIPVSNTINEQLLIAYCSFSFILGFYHVIMMRWHCLPTYCVSLFQR